MYLCYVCHHVTKPGQKLRRHLIRHTTGLDAVGKPLNGQIRRELPVCGRCQHELDLGGDLRSLMVSHAVRVEEAPPPPEPPPPPKVNEAVTVGTPAKVLLGQPVEPLKKTRRPKSSGK